MALLQSDYTTFPWIFSNIAELFPWILSNYFLGFFIYWLRQAKNDIQAAQEAEGVSCSCLAVLGRRLLAKQFTRLLAWAISLFELTIRW